MVMAGVSSLIGNDSGLRMYLTQDAVIYELPQIPVHGRGVHCRETFPYIVRREDVVFVE